MPKLIIGFVGEIASGKDTCADYLAEKYNSVTFSFSSMLIDAVTRFHLEVTRDNLVKMSEAVREKYGENIMAKTIAEDIKNANDELIAIPNIRRDADIEFLKQLTGFVLVRIDAEAKTRYNRLIKRNEKVDDTTKTYEEFLADQNRSTEITIREVAQQATEIIDNNGTLEKLYSQLNSLIQKYQNMSK